MTGEPPGRPSPIAGRVRELRLRRGLSQLRLAELVGRGPMWVDRFEHGQLEWTRRLDGGAVDAGEIPVLGDLAAALGVDIDELAGAASPSRVAVAAAPAVPAAVPAVAPAPVRPARARRRPRAAGIAAAAAGAGLALTGAAVGLARVTTGPSAARPATGSAVASARLGPQPPPAATEEPTLAPPAAPAPLSAAPEIAPTPDPTPRPAPPPRRPTPATAAEVAVRVSATPATKPAGRVTVFPWAVAISVAAGSAYSPQVTFTVSDPDGGGPATLGQVALSNPAVTVVRDSCSHTVLAPGGMCDVTVRFGSAKPGRFTGFLVIPQAGRSAAVVPIEVDAR